MEKGRGSDGEPFGSGGASAVRNEVRDGQCECVKEGNELAVLRGEGMKVGVRGAGSICVKRGESSRSRDSALVATEISEGGERR